MMQKSTFFLLVFIAGLALTGKVEGVEELEFAGGRKIPLSSVRVTANGFATTVPFGNTTQIVNFTAADIVRANFERPAVLDEARRLIASGKAAEAATLLAPLAEKLEPFQAIRGSWWYRVAILQIDALASEGQMDGAVAIADQASEAGLPAEAAALVEDMKLIAATPKLTPDSKATDLLALAQRSADTWLTARARLEMGKLLSDQGKVEEAVKAWLRVYAFHSAEDDLAVRALIAAARGLQQLGLPEDGAHLLNGYLSDHKESPFTTTLKSEVAKLTPKK